MTRGEKTVVANVFAAVALGTHEQACIVLALAWILLAVLP